MKESVKTNWANRAKTYENIDWVNRDETLKAILDFTHDVNVKKALDVGTGTGKVIKCIKKVYPEAECCGIDQSIEMEDELINSNDYIIRQMNCEDIKFEDNIFDIVTARMVFHHVNNLKKAMDEVYRVLKANGKFILCEGTPPSINSVEFYKEVFSYKEERHTFLCDDLVNLFLKAGFGDITVKIVNLSDMSLNNWVENAGTPSGNIEIIQKLHWEADESIKSDYNMKTVDNDILMDWKFVIVCGTKMLTPNE